MQIRIVIGENIIRATLLDNPTSRDLISLLPLTLELKDYASTELVSYLPRKLSTNNAPEGDTPLAGDIGYYAPWGNLALYYRPFQYSPGLIKLGRITSDINALKVAGSVQGRIERAQ